MPRATPALRRTQSPFVAFIDDDETAADDWLGKLYAVHVEMNADVTFGPVRGRAESAAAWKRPYLERFFSRTGPSTSRLTDKVYGCGNSMMTRNSALAGPAPFDISTDETGGEDDLLYARLRMDGARFAWAADAMVDEHAQPHRATVRFAFTRMVSYGQSPTQLALHRGDVLDAVKWGVVGAVQWGAYGLAALVLLMLGRPRWLDLAGASAGGFGKMLWFAHFRFYGQGAVKAAAKQQPAKNTWRLRRRTSEYQSVAVAPDSSRHAELTVAAVATRSE